MGGGKSTDPKDLLVGGVLQCMEAASVGLPFEVWKTHMGTYRSQGTMEAFRNIYRSGGVLAFYRGLQPKLFESFFKGGILLFAKEAIIKNCKGVGMGDVTAGLIGGFGGGVAQVSVIGPMTYLVTAVVSQSGGNKRTITQVIKDTLATKGIGGFYSGGVPLMLRQGSNWASRQGFTDAVRQAMIARKSDGKLNTYEEALSGVIGGALSTWNQPFEVLRIEAQGAAAKGLPAKSIVENAKMIMAESGVVGLFTGVWPRMGLCIAQTVFMVTIPRLIKPYLE